MKFDKYYEQLINNEQINNEFVTYLACIHIINLLTEKDSVTNREILSSGEHFLQIFEKNSNNFDMPLCFVNDDVLNIFDYVYPHLKNILRNPHNQIIKEQQLIDKSKLKILDDKTLKWLSPKSGGTVKEKLANVDKVLSTKKRFSLDIKENQVSLKCFEMLRKLLNKKIELYESNPTIFSKKDIDVMEDVSHKINRIRNTIKMDFDEVQLKDYTEPNNALIGNVDYASLWHSYLNLKKKDYDYSDSFNLFKRVLFLSLILKLMQQYDFIEKYTSNRDAYSYRLNKITKNMLTEITFDDDYSISIKIFDLRNSKSELIKEENYKIVLEKQEETSNRGIPYKLFVNDEFNMLNFADLKGCKETISFLIDTFDLNNKKTKALAVPYKVNLISINSFDNKLIGDNNDSAIVCNDGENVFFVNDVFDCEQNVLSLSDINNKDYYSVLKACENKIDLAKNNILIYDIDDNYDQFSSAKLRSTFSSIYPNSYPVWRSILAAETFGNKDVKTIVDLCGKELSISSVGFKNNRYIHYGPDEIPLYLNKVTENDLYNYYFNLYEEKYGEIPSIVKEKFISTGYLNDTLGSKKSHVLFYRDSYYCLSFDSTIYKKALSLLDDFIIQLTAIYDEKELIIVVPSFVDNSRDYVLNNFELKIGASKISNYVKNKEISWYEHLPELSLEIIKDGMYDSLLLVGNREVENIIGKKLNLDIKEHFLLKAGEKEYRLPLIKSFIGENNKNFEAILKDDSFPLDHDVEVSLQIEYNFESANSYELYFTAVNDEAFKKIDAKWKEDITEKYIIDPVLVSKCNDADAINEIIDQIKNKKFRRVLYHYKNFSYDKEHCDQQTYKFLGSNIIGIINDLQYIKGTDFKNEYNEIREYLRSNQFDSMIIQYHAFVLENYKRYTKSRNKFARVWMYRLKDMEQCIVSLNLDKDLLLNNELVFPHMCIGRYLAEYPQDDDIIDYAYSFLLKSLKSSESLLKDKTFHDFLDRLTSSLVEDPYVFSKISENNISFVLTLSKTIVSVLKDISNYNWLSTLHSYDDNPKEISYLTRYCIELLTPILLCRKMPLFDQFLPGKKLANEVVYYLKIINKNFNNAMDCWHTEDKKPNMHIKYNMIAEKPNDLSRVNMIFYCLILYLTGDEKANLIKAVENNNGQNQ